MSDIADVLNRLNELGRTDLAEVVHSLMGERDGLIKAINSAKTVIESKDKAYSLIQQRWDAMAAKASTVDSERECNERLTSENDALRAELDALRKQEPVAEVDKSIPTCEIQYTAVVGDDGLPDGTKLYAAPVQPAAVAKVPDEPVPHDDCVGCRHDGEAFHGDTYCRRCLKNDSRDNPLPGWEPVNTTAMLAAAQAQKGEK